MLSWAIVEPSVNSTIEWTTDCGCTTTSIGVVGHAEQLVGLDHLEALVHQRAGVDRDLRTHRPRRMGQRLLDADVGAARRPCGRGTGRRWPSAGAGRPPGPAPPTSAGTGARRSARCRRAPARRRASPAAAGRSGPAAIRLSLLARARRLPAAQRGDRDRQPGEADDRVDDDVGRPRRGRRGRRRPWRTGARRRPRPAATDRRRRRRCGRNSLACSMSDVDRRPDAERDDLVAAAPRRARRRASGCRSSRTSRRWRRGRRQLRPGLEHQRHVVRRRAARTGRRRSGRARRRGR